MSQQTSDGMMPALVAMSSDEDESSTIEAANNGSGGHAPDGAVAAASEDVEMGADPDMPALVHVSDESGDEDAEHQPHASARPSAAMGASAQNDAVRAVLFSSYEWIRRGLMPRTFRRGLDSTISSSLELLEQPPLPANAQGPGPTSRALILLNSFDMMSSDVDIGNLPFLNLLQELSSSRRPKIPSPDAMDTLCHMQVRQGEEIDCPITSQHVPPNDWASRMPCGHWHSSDSLLKWLGQSNSCPVCRFELPTTDEGYNRGKSISIEGALAAADSANNRTDDALSQRVQGAKQQLQLEWIANQVSSEILADKVSDVQIGETVLGKRSTPEEMEMGQDSCSKVAKTDKYLDEMCDMVLDEMSICDTS